MLHSIKFRFSWWLHTVMKTVPSVSVRFELRCSCDISDNGIITFLHILIERNLYWPPSLPLVITFNVLLSLASYERRRKIRNKFAWRLTKCIFTIIPASWKKARVAYWMAFHVFLQKAVLSNQNGLTVISWEAQGNLCGGSVIIENLYTHLIISSKGRTF